MLHLARRAGEGPVEHVEDPTKEDDDAADQPLLVDQQPGPDDGDAETDEGQGIGREAEPAHPEGDRLEHLLDA